MPDLVLTTDIIVGFPGETEAEFEDTLKLVEQVGYDAMFTFIYSPRVGIIECDEVVGEFAFITDLTSEKDFEEKLWKLDSVKGYLRLY